VGLAVKSKGRKEGLAGTREVRERGQCPKKGGAVTEPEESATAPASDRTRSPREKEILYETSFSRAERLFD
jgi:hypothetical protein